MISFVAPVNLPSYLLQTILATQKYISSDSVQQALTVKKNLFCKTCIRIRHSVSRTVMDILYRHYWPLPSILDLICYVHVIARTLIWVVTVFKKTKQLALLLLGTFVWDNMLGLDSWMSGLIFFTSKVDCNLEHNCYRFFIWVEIIPFGCVAVKYVLLLLVPEKRQLKIQPDHAKFVYQFLLSTEYVSDEDLRNHYSRSHLGIASSDR